MGDAVTSSFEKRIHQLSLHSMKRDAGLPSSFDLFGEILESGKIGLNSIKELSEMSLKLSMS